MAIASFEQIADHLEDVIEETLRARGRMSDNRARSIAADQLGEVLIDLRDTIAAELATRPKPPGRRPADPGKEKEGVDQ